MRASVRLVNDGIPGGPPCISVNIDNSLKKECDCCRGTINKCKQTCDCYVDTKVIMMMMMIVVVVVLIIIIIIIIIIITKQPHKQNFL